MPYDLTILIPVLFGGILGYGLRWLQDQRAWRKQRKLVDLDFLDDWLYHFTGYMRSVKWLMDDFVRLHSATEDGVRTSSSDELFQSHMNRYATHSTKVDNLAVKMKQLIDRYTELSPLIIELNSYRQGVEATFLKTWESYVEEIDAYGDDLSKKQYMEIQAKYKTPLTEGVKKSRLLFERTWPVITTTHDKTWELEKK